MISQPTWENIKTRMQGYWAREAMDRCTVSIRLFKPGYDPSREHHYYYDAQTASEVWRTGMENRLYFGEAFPALFPYFGTAGIAEYTGCRGNHLPHTTWFEPWMTEEDPDASRIGYAHPGIFERQKKAIADMIRLSRGDYPVSVTDNAGVMDALAEIRGMSSLMTDMVIHPKFVEEGLKRLLPIYKETQEELFTLTQENNGGCIHAWMQLWAPKRMAQLQCDLSVMISGQAFNRFVMPELEELCSFLDYPVYHFDGQEQIRHLDALLSIPKLRAIQWTRVVSQPPTSHFIPVLQKIQRAGKNLILSPRPEEVKTLLDNLSIRGLHLVMDGVRSPEEAQDVMALVEKHSKVRD